MKEQNQKFPLFIMLCVVCMIVLLGALLNPRKAAAQPYYTNSAAQYGAATYNTSLTTPLNPANTLANQYASGTLAGLIPTNQVAYFLYTNTFATNIYTAPPFVTANAGQSGTITNAVVTIVSTSITGFVIQVTPTNVPVYWEATGH